MRGSLTYHGSGSNLHREALWGRLFRLHCHLISCRFAVETIEDGRTDKDGKKQYYHIHYCEEEDRV